MSAEIRKGTVLSRYRLDKLVGGGGSAAVWLAYDVDTNERVALKILRPDLISEQRSKVRALREASLLSTLVHPNLAHCRKAELESDPPYLVMDYVEGRTLGTVMAGLKAQGGKLSFRFVVSVIEQLAGAVDFAHRAGVVHRDLKPANVMVSGTLEAPRATLLDLGVAKILAPNEDDPTTLGRLLGTFAYMSPEQARGAAIDGRSDLFSLGTILFEMLTLRRPWLQDATGELQHFGDSVHASTNPPTEVMKRIDASARPRISAYRPDVPKAIDEVGIKALSISPADRFESGAALASLVAATLAVPVQEAENPTMVTPAPRSETPLYQTVHVQTKLTADPPSPPNTTRVIVPARAPVARLVTLLLVVGGSTALGGWWVGLQMGEARRDPPPPPAVILEAPEPEPEPGVEARPFVAESPPSSPPPPKASSPKTTKPVRKETEPSKGPSVVRRLLAEVEAHEGEIERHRALAEAIERAAQTIADADRKARVVRTARSSAMVGDVAGLRQAVIELEAALGSAP